MFKWRNGCRNVVCTNLKSKRSWLQGYQKTWKPGIWQLRLKNLKCEKLWKIPGILNKFTC